MSIAFSFDQFVVTTLQVYHNYVKQNIPSSTVCASFSRDSFWTNRCTVFISLSSLSSWASSRSGNKQNKILNLQWVWQTSRESLPFGTPGSAPPFGTCLCSNCWYQFSRICLVFVDFSKRQLDQTTCNKWKSSSQEMLLYKMTNLLPVTLKLWQMSDVLDMLVKGDWPWLRLRGFC